MGCKTTVADIAIWGYRPPPYGGMSVHVERLIPVLRAAGYTVRCYSLVMQTEDRPDTTQVAKRRGRWFAGLLFGPCERFHYVMGGRPVTRFLAAVLGIVRRRKVILRIGGESLAKAAIDGGLLHRWMIRFAIRHVAGVVGVNQEICDLAVSLGASPKRVHRIPGFIAPTDDGRNPPEAVMRFIRTGTPVLVCAGQVMPKGEADIYGLNLMLEAASRLLAKHRGMRIVVVLYEIAHVDSSLIVGYERRVREFGMGGSLLVYHNRGELWPLLKACDLMVRPTLTDGDANSIREALHFGVPVVASDCVKRPAGVEVFSSGNLEALVAAVDKVLGSLPSYRAMARKAATPGNAAAIVRLFAMAG